MPLTRSLVFSSSTNPWESSSPRTHRAGTAARTARRPRRRLQSIGSSIHCINKMKQWIDLNSVFTPNAKENIPISLPPVAQREGKELIAFSVCKLQLLHEPASNSTTNGSLFCSYAIQKNTWLLTNKNSPCQSLKDLDFFTTRS